MRAYGTCLAAVAIALLAAQANAQVQSTFDTDLDDWLVTGDNDFYWQGSGGNPGGYLHVHDLATGDHNYASAPPKFLGDWSGFTSSDVISVDIYLHNTSGGGLGHACPYWMFEISGPGGKAYTIDGCTYVPPEDAWTNYQVTFDESNWIVESGTWTAILEDVTSLLINAEFIHGEEWVGVDNVTLSSSPITKYSPRVYSDFNSPGTGNWTFQNTSGVSNPESGGNGGGYAKFADKSGANSYAYAPSMFLGDWSALNNWGYITIDLRILSHSGSNLGSFEFIRLTGPGGSAYVSLDPSDIPEDRRIWKTFTFPIDSSTWTVDSGTWAGLLSHVAQCRIDMEFYDGTESVGFDNFGRLEYGCSPIDVPIEIQVTGISYCGYHSLIDAASTAFNPIDSELYGLVRLSPGSGGGLYTVTGTDPGLWLQSYDTPGHTIFDTDGDAFVSHPVSGEIHRLEWGGSSSLWVNGFHSGDDDPTGMTFAPTGFNGPNVSEGDILVTDSGYNGPDEIWAFSPDTPEGELQVLPDQAGPIFYDIAATQDGTVYVCDGATPDSLFILDPAGALTSLALDESVGAIVSVVYDDSESQIYIAEWDSETVWRVDPSTGNATLVATGFTSFNQTPLEIDSASRRLWIADEGYNRVYELCLDGYTSVGETPPRAAGNLLSIAPNPFSWLTRISFSMPGSGAVDVLIHDASGRLVRHLRTDWLSTRSGTVAWDGRDARGRRVPSGIYLVCARAGGFMQTGRVLVVK